MEFRNSRAVGLALLAILSPSCGEFGRVSSSSTQGGRGWITLTIPTSEPTYWTDSWTVTLGGEAFIGAWSYAGQVAPAVAWTNDQAGISGTATDSVTWGYLLGTIYPVRRVWTAVVPLVGGTNVIRVSATSGSDWGKDQIKVTRPAGNNPPHISIDPIAPGGVTVTNTIPLVLHGTASGYLGITSVTWSNAATGGSGSALGTMPWTASIPLALGPNPITVTATDPSGKTANDSVTIAYDPSRSGPFPPGPTDVVASAGDGAVTLRWAAVPGASSYNIYRATVPGVLKSTSDTLPGGAVVPTVQSPFAVTGLTNGTPYYFVVTAVDGIGEGVESSEVSATPFAGPTAPVTLDADSVSSTAARLNGSLFPPAGLQTTVWFEYGTSPSLGLSTPAAPVPAGALATVSADVSSLIGGTTYYFQLVTQNGAGTFAGETRSFYTPLAPVILVSGLDAATDLAVDAASAYWVETYGSAVKKVATAGGSVTVLASPVMVGNGASLAIDATTATFADYGTIWQVPLSGGPTVTVVSGRPQITRVRTSGAAVYWREEGAIRGIDGPGGTVATIATGPSIFGGDLAVDSSGVYWTDYWGGLVQRAPPGGGEITTLASGLDHPNALLLDSGVLYFAEGTAIRKVPAAGGAVTTVVSGISPGVIAKDSTSIYWGDSGTFVRKAGLSSGIVTTLITGENGFYGMAVDGTSIYWVTPGSRYEPAYGKLKKAPKG